MIELSGKSGCGESLSSPRLIRHTRARSRTAAAAVVLTAMTLAAFAPLWQAGFVYDDALYILDNPEVRGGLTLTALRWDFTSFHAFNWHPLTWISHQVDAQLFGLDPRGHHLVSLTIHLANTVLLLTLLNLLTGSLGAASLAAGLFALHPLHVESVAWVAERKDLLAAFFMFLALRAYLGYTRRPGTGRYLAVAVLFGLGLISKPMLVTFPFVLLLLDWWPLGRLWPAPGAASGSRRVVMEKVPFLLLSVASSIVTYLAQREGGALVSFPLRARVANALVSVLSYLGKTVWPDKLAVYYPHPGSSLPGWKTAAALAVLAGLCALAIRQRRSRPYLLMGWCWFAGMLVPVAGLVQVGGQAMADRYTYLPLVGIFLAAGSGWRDLGGERRRAAAWVIVPAVVLVMLGALTWRQAGYWRDEATLFGHAREVTSGNWLAESGLGRVLAARGDLDEGIRHLRESLRINPYIALNHYNLGKALALLGRPEEAVGAYRDAVNLQPDYPDAWYNLGNACLKLGRNAQAVEAFRQALRWSPGYAAAWNNLGIAYRDSGRRSEAREAFREAVRLRPDHALARLNLGLVSLALGDVESALAEYRILERLDREKARTLASALALPGEASPP